MIIAYLRVSTGRQCLSNQREEIRRYAGNRDWVIDRWVTEVASGSRAGSDRKLGLLLRQMKRGDTLIVTEVSRLSRTLTDIMGIMGLCLEKGIRLYTTKEGYSFVLCGKDNHFLSEEQDSSNKILSLCHLCRLSAFFRTGWKEAFPV